MKLFEHDQKFHKAGQPNNIENYRAEYLNDLAKEIALDNFDYIVNADGDINYDLIQGDDLSDLRSWTIARVESADAVVHIGSVA